jgi:hypothetical protein
VFSLFCRAPESPRQSRGFTSINYRKPHFVKFIDNMPLLDSGTSDRDRINALHQC